MKNLIITALLVSFEFGYSATTQSVAMNTDGTAVDKSAIVDVKNNKECCQ
jgi:hypothetical protein